MEQTKLRESEEGSEGNHLHTEIKQSDCSKQNDWIKLLFFSHQRVVSSVGLEH